MCCSAYCFLCQLRQVVRSVSVDAAQTVVTFISSCLDYYNLLVYGISDILLRHLQAMQNAAARMVTGTTSFQLPPPGTIRFYHQTISSALSLVPVHISLIQYLLLLDQAFGTIFLHVPQLDVYSLDTFCCKLKTYLTVRGTSA